MDLDDSDDLDDILDKYRQDIDSSEMGSTGRIESREYQRYKEAEVTQREEGWYERLVNRLSFFSFEFDDLVEEHRNAIRLLNYQIEPDQIGPAASVVAIIVAIFALPMLLAPIPTIFKIALILVPLGVFGYLVKYPWLKARQKVIKSSEDLILAILYMVISMRSSPNIERAVGFAARHLEGPVEQDMKLVLWRLDVRQYETIEEGLSDYISRWKPYNKGFVDSVNLILSATQEGNPEKRREILGEAVDMLLGNTQDRMEDFSQQLRLPVMVLHGMGILLPVLGVIMFPLVASFMGGENLSIYLALLYNVLIPLGVYAIMVNLLVNRPLSLSSQSGRLTDVDTGSVNVEIGDRSFGVPVILISAPLFLGLFWWPATHYFDVLVFGDGIPISPPLFTLVREMMLLVALSVPLGIHLYLGYRDTVKRQEEIREMEIEFPEALFELSNALGRGKPIEMAITEAAREADELEISDLFEIAAVNMHSRGLTFDEAMFDSSYGALKRYPSELIGTVMEVLSESAQRGAQSAADAADNIFQYLERIKETQKKLEDLLSETLTSLKFLGFILAPVIGGVAVGLGSVITLALDKISEISDFEDGFQPGGANATPENLTGAGTTPDTAGIASIFGVEQAIPPGILQLIVGLYLIQVSLIVSTMYVRLSEGRNRPKRFVMAGKMMIASIVIYIIGVTIMYMVFGSIIKGAVNI